MTRRSVGPCAVLSALLAGSLSAAVPLPAQQEPDWNAPRALQLMERARAERRTTVVDTALRAYRADARGYVYFFLDRPDSDERTLVKADQIALQVFWQAPNRTHQTIVGLRDKKVLPTNIHYHLDHLTVVQDDFGDRIRLGDGDEVSEVVHPAAPASGSYYDFAITDSLSIRYGAAEEGVRVYEVQVRPKDPDRPGFVGAVYLDRGTAAIVRMRFTFTPASYVDPDLDYIRISLDNALWMGKHWLPYRQEVELRREIPQLDFLAGSIIRGRFEIGPYAFNPEISPVTFIGPRVTALPPARRAAFPFEQGLFDDIRDEGIAPAPSLEAIRAQAQQIVRQRALSGLDPLRLHWQSVSDGIRYDRAEGLYLGGGMEFLPLPHTRLRTSGGYAFGRQRAAAALSVTRTTGAVVPVLQGYWNELRDLGPFPGASPLLSSLGTVGMDRDWQDPWFASGARLTLRGSLPDVGPSVSVRLERQTSGRNVLAEQGLPPVRPVTEGTLAALDARLPRRLPLRGESVTYLTAGRLAGRDFASARVATWWGREGPGRAFTIRFSGDAGIASPRTPVQELYFLGGRETLPGYDFRRYAGRAFWLARVEGTHPLLQPWVGVRAFAALGATWLGHASLPVDGWTDAQDTRGALASVGAGLSLGWDVLRLDLARGLGPGGRWELIFSVDPRFRPWL